MKKEFRRRLFEEHDSQAEAAYIEGRRQKARKIKAVLADFGKTSGSLLDIGCSLGIASDFLSRDFKVTGIDVDEQAIAYAVDKCPRASFLARKGEDTGFDDESFDVVVCAGVYEHVREPAKLMKEIRRVLRPQGVCYFTAMNRFIIMEPHYQLPFLSYLPRPAGNIYLYLLRGEPYTVNSLSIRGLKSLVSGFEIFDYTIRIIKEPDRFYASDVVASGSAKQKMALLIAKYMYSMVPTYVWLLRKA